MNEENLRKKLCIDEYLEQIKDHKCCERAVRSIQRYMYVLEKENTNFKQSLIAISELVKNESVKVDENYTEVCCNGDEILQITNKALEGNN
ncbi:MAG: hypothetical protein K2G03_03375, partial [Bacilli bacterium]|nr:hypothetical protein [Bacilli bacterium]